LAFIKEAIHKAVTCQNLSAEEARLTMTELIDGTASPSQIASLLTALRMKGETVDEIAAFATVMREHARKINPRVSSRLTDTCGTGGDALKTFNISTLSALVVAGAGAPIAKHGNRSFTSRCGSADLLEKLGVNLNAKPEKVEKSIEQAGIGFMFAQVFHSAARNVSRPRKEIGIRTVFNILGPLTNPANTKAQLLGVYDDGLVLKLAEVLVKLGIESAIVAHGMDGFDEISIIGKSHIAGFHDGGIKEEILTPQSFGLELRKFDEISAPEEIDEHVLVALRVLSSSKEQKNAVRDTVLANSSAGLVASGMVTNYLEGVEIARSSLKSGKALDKLTQLVKYSGGDIAVTEELLRKI
jgi:anthranilate phosphoribosyltransferase